MTIATRAKTVEIHVGGTCNCGYPLRHMVIRDPQNPELTRVIALKLAPRPEDKRGGMTRLGALRDEYNATVEAHPPRFVSTPQGYRANPAYFEWASRADTWAAI